MRLILQLGAGRRRALEAARAETLAVLEPFGPSLPVGGPFGDIGGLFWVDLASPAQTLEHRLPLLAYARAAYELIALPTAPPNHRRSSPSMDRLPATVSWRGGWFSLQERWRRDEVAERESAPDRRAFLLPTPEGAVREVRGYRGGRRGLPPADARLTVNLSLTRHCRRLLDPFAGAGGIVAAARLHGLEVVSADIDPLLRHGLPGLGATHCIADARRLPLADESMDAVATEPPYAQELTTAVVEALAELARVVRQGGRLCLFCSEAQTPALLAASKPQLTLLHRFRIDRKGTACEALVWERR